MLKPELFLELCQPTKDQENDAAFASLSPKIIKVYLLALELAVEIDDGSGTLFIPSLVTNEEDQDKLYMNNYPLEQFKVTMPNLCFSNFHEIIKKLQKDTENIDVEDIFYKHLGKGGFQINKHGCIQELSSYAHTTLYTMIFDI